jgi:hypothetical protein
VGLLLIVSVAAFARTRDLPDALQLIGAASLLVVVLAHVCEGLHWFPSMQWGEPHSMGHYLDLAGAGLGMTLFPLGYLLRLRRLAVMRRREHSAASEGRPTKR